MLTRSDIFASLAALGIRHDDKITIHTSLRAVGPIDGGADGLLDALCAYLYDGLLLIPTHTWANVNHANPRFDVRKTPPCIGTLPTVAAFRPDGFRSLHPTHSLTGFGPGAKEYLTGEEACRTPAPMGHALSRLYEERGKILLLGVGHDKNTYLHAVDERFDIPNRISDAPFDVEITDHAGKTFTIEKYHPHAGHCSQYYPNYKAALEYTGAVTYGQLGNALVYCCDARKMTDTVAMLWKKAEYDLCAETREIPQRYYR